MHHRDGITKFHHVVHKHLDEIGPGGFEFDLAEDHHAAGVQGGVAQLKFHFAFAEHRGLVGRNQPDAFREPADARRPAVEDAEPGSDDGQLRHADEADDADEEQISVGFLPHFLA